MSLSFCVIFEIQCHFHRYIINKYKYLLYKALFSFKNENDTKWQWHKMTYFCQDNCQNATQSLGQIRSWSFRSNSFSDGKKVLKIVYINNILFIYTIFRRGIIFLFWFWPKWPWPNLTGITLKIYTTRKFVLKFVIIPLLWFFYITFASTYTFSNRPCCQDNRAVC